MAAIRKLSQEIIGRIAAGEVVERPASVVKEMVENAIDAGAQHITVEVRGGGVEYLRITDDGKGIPAEEIRMAFERHATSKLQTAEQLFDIHTLGFRGEALASVAAVAKVTCTTKTADAPLGIRAKIEGGEFVDIRQAASPVGTTFVVEDLFYNTPVRRKFLKKPGMEASMVSDYMLRLMLSHPEISFRFVNQGKTVYQTIGDGKLESVLYRVYGKEAFSQMHKVTGNMNGLILEGYVGVGEMSRGNRQQQSFFINGRYFRSGLMSRALESGCEGRVMIGRFPMCALFLTLPNQLVDVNVHPNKLEVRFQNENAIAQAVKTLVSEALHRQTLGSQLASGAVSSLTDVPQTENASGGFTIIPVGEHPETAVPVVKEEPQTKSAYEPAVKTRPEPENTVQVPELAKNGFVLRPQPPVIKDTSRKSDSFESEKETSNPAEARALYTDFVPTLTGMGVPVMHESSPGEASRTVQRLAEQQTQDEINARLTARRVEKQIKQQEAPAKTSVPEAEPARQAEPSVPVSRQQVETEAKPQTGPADRTEQTRLLEEAAPEEGLKLIGIAFSTYWIFECGDRLLLLDQHAAHERMLYDRMMARFEGTSVSQRLLAPVLVQMTQHDLALLEELQEVLTDAGFDVQLFDETSAAIHAIPTLFGENADPRTLFLDALDEWQAGRGAVTRERMRKQIAQMACKRAIKAGDKLSEDEIQAFLRDMLRSESMPTCPHGRPIVTEVTRYALEKRFKRIQ